MSLQTTARAIRRARPLAIQRQIAASGEHPLRGTWWPKWKPWTHMTDPVRAILTRFTKGPHGTGARAGRIGGKSRSLAKATAARVNGRFSRGPLRSRARVVPVSSEIRNGPVFRGGSQPSSRGAR